MSAVVSLLSSDPDVVVSMVVLSLLSAELLSPAAAQDVRVLLLPVVVVVVSELSLSSSDVPPVDADESVASSPAVESSDGVGVDEPESSAAVASASLVDIGSLLDE